MNKNWFKINPRYYESHGVQLGLTIPIIRHNLATQFSYSLCNSQYDTDGEFTTDYIDRQLGHNIAINLLGTWDEDWDSEFRFLFNVGYDINDLKLDNEKLLDGLSIGLGFQVIDAY